MVRALLHLLTLSAPIPKLDDISDLIYNIGQGQPITVNEMIEHIKVVVPKPQWPRLKTTEVPASMLNYVENTWGDPSKLVHTGFQPLFPNNIANLRFIYACLRADRSDYWALLKQIRNQRSDPRLAIG